eukprot:1145791-Pelagomonas_calceolata.AAC.3
MERGGFSLLPWNDRESGYGLRRSLDEGASRGTSAEVKLGYNGYSGYKGLVYSPRLWLISSIGRVLPQRN